MLKKVRFLGFCFVLGGLLLGPARALGQNYVTVYSEDFSSNPGWDTNNSSRYYWRSPKQTYQITMFDNTNEYGTVAVPYGGRSFRLQFDIYIDAMNWAGNINVGIYDPSREAYVPISGTQFARIDFGIGDLGRGLQLRAVDENQVDYVAGEYPTSSWDFNTWYTGIITYDASLGALEWELRDRDTGLLLNTLAVSGISGFSTLENLGASKVGDTYAPSAYGRGQLDNVSFSEVASCDIQGITYRDQVDTGCRASGIVISPDESKLYVACWESPPDGTVARVLEYSLPDLTQLQTILTSSNHGEVVVSGDGSRIFFPNYYPSTVTQVELDNANAMTNLSTVDSWPAGISMTPDKTKVLATVGQDGRSYDMGNDSIAIYDIAAANFALLASVQLQDEPLGSSIGVSEDSRFAYVGTIKRQSTNPKLYEISLEAPYTVTRTMEFPEAPDRVGETRCLGNRVFISDAANSKIWVVDRSSWTKTGYALESAPGALEVHPSGAYLFVMMPDIGSVVAIDVASMSIVARYDGLSSGPYDIEFNNDGTKMYIAHRSSAGEIMVFDLGCAGPACDNFDDFEDGVIDPTLWEWGGTKRGIGCGGSWQWSHQEAGGFLETRVWGPTSGNTYGSEAWVRTTYDYNDGANYIINFTWEIDTNASHVDDYAIHITDGTIPGGCDVHWLARADEAGWVTLYFTESDPGDMLPTDWSICVDAASDTGTVFNGPDCTGSFMGQGTLPPGEPWYVRFILADGTSAGFPAGDNRLNLYDFCATKVIGCGDGVVDPGEVCDDGNNTDCDGCRADCSAVETGCGDGFICGVEVCDDGNNTDCDGCRADCSAVESGCGDSFVCGTEVCDDGNNLDCDGCRADCSAVETGCGDGFVCGAEACDDGNNMDCDGCRADCSATETGCGDGFVCGIEECDDAGESATCDADCTVAYCGDGARNSAAGEECDRSDNDGCPNTDNGDGPKLCRRSCLCAPPTCGDGVIDPGEACDGEEDDLCWLKGCRSDCTCELARPLTPTTDGVPLKGPEDAFLEQLDLTP